MKQTKRAEAKKCSDCKNFKLLSFYRKNAARHDGLNSRCKACHNLQSKKKVTRAKIFVLEYLKNHFCVDCGESDAVVLEFDHIADKKMTISFMIKRGKPIDKIFEEIVKCQVRCANCHRRKTAKDFGYYRINKKDFVGRGEKEYGS